MTSSQTECDFTLANVVLAPHNNTIAPLGCLYLISCLEENGYSVEFRDYQLSNPESPLDPENIAAFLEPSSEVIGIGCIFNALPSVLIAVEKIKKKHPDKKIILGGPGPSAVAEHIMQHFPAVDVIVRGEGEKTIVELLAALHNHNGLENVCGVCYREESQIHINPQQERIRDLDSLSFPAYHKIRMDDYSYFGVMTSRGCPYKCSFCQVSPLWGHTNHQRSVRNVVDELVLLRSKYGIREIHICDDTFVLNKKRVMDFCREVKTRVPDLRWECLGRINLMDEELMEEMSSAGCQGVQYGIESGSNNILQRINKGFSKQMARDIMAKSIKHFEHIISTFIWGFPFESMDDFYETIFFMSTLVTMGSGIKLYLLSPSPLSQLYKEYKEHLKYSTELCSELVWKGYPDSIYNEEITNLVRLYPDIFPDFYYIDSGNILEKYHILKDSGLMS